MTPLDGTSVSALSLQDWPLSSVRDDKPGSLARFGGHEAVDALRSTRVMFGKGSLVAEPTRALMAVDMNSAGSSSTAAGERRISRPLEPATRASLTRSGGQIVIDIAPRAKRDRCRVEDTAKSAFRACPVDTTLAGWTPLGHIACPRKCERLPLHEVMT